MSGNFEGVRNLSSEDPKLGMYTGILISSLEIGMPCGFKFNVLDELVHGSDVPCPCGDLKHWLVRWVKPVSNEKRPVE
jgi:hypothetical protein